MTHLLLTVRFLDDRYHGLLDRGGPPEWPPSPFRLFQALVAGVGRRGELDSPVGQSLGWLQKLDPPIIIAPNHKVGQAITRFVPNNDGDKKFDRQERLTAKPTIPTLFLLEPDQKPEVHYIWDISNASNAPVDRIRDAARSLTTLGWGIDMAFADARIVSEADLQELKGVRWYPKKRDWPFRDTLRTPTYDDDSGECTLCDLLHCHSTFINRIEHGKPLKMVDKPKVFDRVLYTSVVRPAGRPTVIFRLLNQDAEPARHSQPLLAHIAAVVRHAAISYIGENGTNAPSWIPKEQRGAWVSRFVRGKNDPPRDDHQQISYVPLPSIGHPDADAMIRNVMLVAPIGCERELEYVATRLSDLSLEFKEQAEVCDADTPSRISLPRALERFKPSRRSRRGFIRKRYLGRSTVWTSVTPVVLDEHIVKKLSALEDGRTIKRRDDEDFKRLIILALRRAGIETACRFGWQTIPFFKNCLSAHRYDRNRRPNFVPPKRLDGKTAVHLRIEFDYPVSGPITLGAGRHCGFGLMATTES